MMKVMDMVQVARSDAHYASERPIGNQQLVVYVMCGGGMLGRLAAEQPADFYIDSRYGRLPYKKAEILQAVQVLATIASARGLDPHNLPSLPGFHACGIL